MTKIVKFRPKARIINTLGAEIIKDSYAAIIELVKNAYDADAKYVIIKFVSLNTENAKIIIADDGHGMAYEVVTNIWMIPGTSDKVKRNISPSGRILLGAKGIGRLAAGRLGDILTLETTDIKNKTTIIKINWTTFFEDKFLDEIAVNVEVEDKGKSPGTELIIERISNDWMQKDTIKKLRTELRKLLSPVIFKKEEFGIFLDFDESLIEDFKEYHGDIEPFPIFEYYDYRLWGTISEYGKMELEYQNGIDRRIPVETIKQTLDVKELNVRLNANKLLFGSIKIDIRVFDRDPEAMDELIKRSELKDGDGIYFGKNEAKRVLNDLSGINLFREGFRIRPYGDPGNDWLALDKTRVQNPTMRIGSNQIAGYIQIDSEKNSDLKEKSSREGLLENNSFFDLIKVVKKCLSILEEKRYNFRKKIGRGRTSPEIEKAITEFLSIDKLQNDINKYLTTTVKDENIRNEVNNIIEKEFEEKTKDFVKIQDTLSVYEGQVTLGKIVGIIMHEGKKPIKYIHEQSPRIGNWLTFLRDKNILAPDEAIFSTEEILNRLSQLKFESDILISLFNQLDPLAVRKRIVSKKNLMNGLIDNAITLFNTELKNNNIKVIKNYFDKYYFYGSDYDIYKTITNLFDNSIYWLSVTEKNNKSITINMFYDEGFLILDFVDNGPGIKNEFIGSVFEPGFSTKYRGTGLGLSIAGESISRNNGTIKLLENNNGVYFRITLIKGENI